MNKSEEIFVIANNNTNKIKEKGSQFIGLSYKVENENDANNYLNEVRKKYYDATHHCYAYKLKSNNEKYSDDGEPNGTAGIRILNSINHFNLTEILVVIVRYFGGTKLGVGPLGKAYGDTALDLLKNSVIIKLTKFEKILLHFNYDEISIIHHLLNKYKCKQINNIYKETPSIECVIEPFKINSFNSELIEKTNAKANFEATKEVFYLELK